MTQYLTIDDALQVLDRLGFTIRDAGLLASALARPATVVGGLDAYPTLERKAAALLDSMIRNHSLIDGNKRTAWSLTSLFLWINGMRLATDADSAFDLVIGVAENRLGLDDAEQSIAIWCARRDSNPQPSDP